MLVLSRNIVIYRQSMRNIMLVLSRNIVNCRQSMRTIMLVLSRNIVICRVEQEYSHLSSIDEDYYAC